ncbi:MAG: nucleotide pyrophosphohydrolase [Nitrosomonadaceae bacterium]|nr:nucleotide pyrophosphohydrolase [Nitrosomonadaceae bacterium]|tara:strand:- start:357 stop:722 length:366 start_codon:yes stop_codon:yes gene_type:complete
MDINNIQEKLAVFSDQRDWNQFQSPKNLSMGLVREASELLEIFQWLTEQQSREIVNSDKQMLLVKEEIADVFLFLARLADILNIDIEKAALQKIKINKIKYPISLSKGNMEKYNRRNTNAY